MQHFIIYRIFPHIFPSHFFFIAPLWGIDIISILQIQKLRLTLRKWPVKTAPPLLLPVSFTSKTKLECHSFTMELTVSKRQPLNFPLPPPQLSSLVHRTPTSGHPDYPQPYISIVGTRSDTEHHTHACTQAQPRSYGSMICIRIKIGTNLVQCQLFE